LSFGAKIHKNIEVNLTFLQQNNCFPRIIRIFALSTKEVSGYEYKEVSIRHAHDGDDNNSVWAVKGVSDKKYYARVIGKNL
jgi:hypothetical protein